MMYIKILIVVVIIAAISIIVTTILTNNTNYLDLPVHDKLSQHDEPDTLISVQVVFRHGVRTPEPGALYPLDPYNNYSFYPENYGDLTNRGRRYSYILGQKLRDRYNDFLGGDYFYPGIVQSFTSGYDRTQMTLQCVLAGLFPDRNSVFGIPWRPITFESFDFEDDTIIGIMANCKTLEKPARKPTDNETIKLFEFISEKAGFKIETYFDMLEVTNAFEVESANGLELPDWGKPFYPEPLQSFDGIAWAEWAQLNARFGVAGLLKTITKNAVNAVSNINDYTSDDINAKIILFAGHDYNLQFLLHALRVEHMSSTYSAHIIFELHKINGTYGFKIFYDNFIDGQLVLLHVPFCKNANGDEAFCPLHIFIWNTEWFYNPRPSCPKN